MPAFQSDGVEIAYLDEGTGDPILLVHGFASNIATNWGDPGWIRHLVRDGRRVVAIDNRGHGASARLHDPAAYGAPIMAEDCRRLLDHLSIATADVMGYSLGGGVAWQIAIRHPDVVRRLVTISAAVKRSGLYPEVIAAMAGVNAEAAETMKPSPIWS